MENLKKKPQKGILKQSSSFEQSESMAPIKNPADVKWNEMNILQTLHPADKDYGHMKIEEPKTPYSYGTDETSSDACGAGDLSEPKPLDHQLDTELLARKLCTHDSIEEEHNDGSDIEDEDLTEEEREKRREFEMKRKSHYNEFQAVKLARQLLAQEDEDDEDDDGDSKVNNDNNGKNDNEGDASMASMGADSTSGE